MLPLEPVCDGRTSERGCAEADGVTEPSSKLRAVRRALERRDWAASILVERTIRDGIAMMVVAFAAGYLR